MSTDAGELSRITERLEQVSAELDADPDPERAAELIREASELSAKAGQEVQEALRAAAEAQRAD